MATLYSMAAITLWLGLYPQPVLDTAALAINGPRNIATGQYHSGAE
jgi:NADH-quinone oxidoreductase subunit M